MMNRPESQTIKATIAWLNDRIAMCQAEIDRLVQAIAVLNEDEAPLLFAPAEPIKAKTVPLVTVKDLVIKLKKRGTLDNRNRVLAFLDNGPKTGPEIAAHLMEHGTIRKTSHNTVYNLKKHGYIKQDAKSGLYSLRDIEVGQQP